MPVSRTSSKGEFRNSPIQINEYESSVIDEITLERLRQSRIIAQQLETIGKLHRALAKFTDRDTRRISFGNESYTANEPSIMEDELLHHTADVGCQTDITMSHDIDLSGRTRVEWISSPHEFSVLESSSRVMSFDDGVVPRRKVAYTTTHSSATTTPSSTGVSLPRQALSEGDSPLAGLDIEMMYGSFLPNSGAPPTVHEEVDPLSPRTIARYRMESFDEPNDIFKLSDLTGNWWTGFSLVHLDEPTNWSSCLRGRYGLRGIEVRMKGSGVGMSGLPGGLELDGEFENNQLRWTNGQVWTKEGSR